MIYSLVLIMCLVGFGHVRINRRRLLESHAHKMQNIPHSNSGVSYVYRLGIWFLWYLLRVMLEFIDMLFFREQISLRNFPSVLPTRQYVPWIPQILSFSNTFRRHFLSLRKAEPVRIFVLCNVMNNEQ